MKKVLVYSSHLLALIVLVALALAGCATQNSTGSNSSGPVTVNLGYFPNITHAVALVGVARGTFQQALGSNVKLNSKIFNAGPAEIEALFAGDIDIGYVGPSPAVNGFVQSHGQALRIIAGASSGGVLFVVRPGANIHVPADLANKTIADPQVGGTQQERIASCSFRKLHCSPGWTCNIMSSMVYGKLECPQKYAPRWLSAS